MDRMRGGGGGLDPSKDAGMKQKSVACFLREYFCNILVIGLETK